MNKIFENKILFNMLMSIFLIFILFLLIKNPLVVANEVNQATILWYTTLLPAMYPSLVAIDILESSPLPAKIGKLLFPFFKFLFRIKSPKSSFIIILSLICGAPASTKIISQAIEKKEMDTVEGENLIAVFSCLSLPYTLFILPKIGINPLIYLAFYLAVAIILMQALNKNTLPSSHTIEKTDVNYPKIFLNSINKNLTIMLSILGIIIIFKVLTALLLPKDFIFYPFIEILGGIAGSKSNFLILAAIGFLGLSIHIQILSIKSDFNYFKFLIIRIIFSSLAFLTFF